MERGLIVGYGTCLPVAFFDDLDLMLHCDGDALVTHERCDCARLGD